MKTFLKNFHILLIVILSSGCQRSISWDLSAKGTLKNAEGVCLPYNVHGTFYNGAVPDEDTAYIEVNVNVFTIGAYTIFTDIQNGFRFIDSGVFNTKGIHVIKLRPYGKPSAPGLTNFTISFDTSICSLTVDVKDSGNTSFNTWRYRDTKNGISYQGTINATHFLITPSSTLLSLRKESPERTDTIFEINLAFPTEFITPGVYKTDSLNSVSLSTQGRCINCAWDVVYKLKGAITTIVVKSYEPSSKIIKGTFSGTTVDADNNVAAIEDGAFTAVVEK